MIKINKILKYLKKNIYLVCLILALSYIAYNKLYKNKESFDNLLGMNDEYSGINKHILADLKEKEIPIPDDYTRQSFILKHKILKYLKDDKLVELASKNEFTKEIYDDILQDWESILDGGEGREEGDRPNAADSFKTAFTMDKFPYWMQLFYYIEENQITDFLNNINNNDKLLSYLERITSRNEVVRYLPPISGHSFDEFCKVILTNLIKTSHNKIFGKKDERTILKDIEPTDAIQFDNTKTENTKKIWLDINSIKVNGSKNLIMVDVNRYNLLKQNLLKTEEKLKQNRSDLLKTEEKNRRLQEFSDYSKNYHIEKINKCRNRGLLSRILNKRC